jgi:hypothetical protein
MICGRAKTGPRNDRHMLTDEVALSATVEATVPPFRHDVSVPARMLRTQISFRRLARRART